MVYTRNYGNSSTTTRRSGLDLVVHRPNPFRKRGLSAAALVLFGMNLQLTAGATTAGLIAAVTIAYWLPAAVSHRGGQVVFGSVLFCLISGVILFLARPYGLEYTRTGALTLTAYFLSIGLAATMALVILKFQGIEFCIAWYAVGFLGSVLFRYSALSGNIWKFALAIPVTLLLILLLSRILGKLTGSLVALLLSASYSGVSDTRSAVGFAVAAGLATAVGFVLNRRRVSPSVLVATAGGAAVIGWLLYEALERLLISGRLGEASAVRTQRQLLRSTNLIDAGRPEWRVTAALFRDYPLGFGPGAVPNLDMRFLGADALSSVKLDLFSNVYLKSYVFGPVLKVHSIIGDLWSNFGLVGLFLGILAFATMGYAFVVQLFGRRASAAVYYLLLQGMWSCLFSPILSNFAPTMFAFVIACAVIERERHERDRMKVGPLRHAKSRASRSEAIRVGQFTQPPGPRTSS